MICSSTVKFFFQNILWQGRVLLLKLYKPYEISEHTSSTEISKSNGRHLIMHISLQLGAAGLAKPKNNMPPYPQG